MRRQYPQFFQRTRKLIIEDKEYQTYGNLFLFRNPDKEAVKISRSFYKEEILEEKGAWLSTGSKGTILVSPFISKAEKEIRNEAEALGAKIILKAFPERFKPAAHDFELSAEWGLVIFSLGLPPGTELSRASAFK